MTHVTIEHIEKKRALKAVRDEIKNWKRQTKGLIFAHTRREKSKSSSGFEPDAVLQRGTGC